MNAKQWLPVVITLALTATAHAQGGFFGNPPPGGFGGPPGGRFQPSPAMQGRFQAWQTWRSTHRNVLLLGRTLSVMADMNDDPRTTYTKPQAKAILAIIHTWEKKPALNDEQARQVNAQITAPLTLTQIKKLSADAQPQGGGFGGGRPGDGGGFRGGRGTFNPASFPAPRDYNPLNPATNPMVRGRERAQQRHVLLMAALTSAK